MIQFIILKIQCKLMTEEKWILKTGNKQKKSP